MWCQDDQEIIYHETEPYISLVGDRPEAIVMQYTGFKDRTGRDIYEGDVLCIEDYYHDYQDGIAINKLPDNQIEPVAWDESGMWQTGNETLIEVCAISEIIGNIYENPELINQTC